MASELYELTEFVPEYFKGRKGTKKFKILRHKVPNFYTLTLGQGKFLYKLFLIYNIICAYKYICVN